MGVSVPFTLLERVLKVAENARLLIISASLPSFKLRLRYTAQRLLHYVSHNLP